VEVVDRQEEWGHLQEEQEILRQLVRLKEIQEELLLILFMQELEEVEHQRQELLLQIHILVQRVEQVQQIQFQDQQ
jgi:hypothetical protein